MLLKVQGSCLSGCHGTPSHCTGAALPPPQLALHQAASPSPPTGLHCSSAAKPPPAPCLQELSYTKALLG